MSAPGTGGEGGRPVTVFVADDEELARAHLAELAGRVPWARQVGEAGDGPAALRAVDELRPDVVFLDVAMPGLSGLELAERLAYRPVLVFTTASDRHAVAAFDLEATDYLLKPFGFRRFLAAMERARRALAAREEPAGGAEPPPGPLDDRLLVRRTRGIVPVPLAQVERLEADDDYVIVHAAGQRHTVTGRLSALAERLDPRRFLRVHRSHVVNLDHVQSFATLPDGRLEVVMKGGDRVVASRSRSREIRGMSL